MSLSNLDKQLTIALEKRAAINLLMSLPENDESQVDFSSNDYLGLARNTTLHKQVEKEITTISDYKLGSGGSRLLAGNTSYYIEVEKQLASLFRKDAALLFNAGYVANMAFFSTIPRKGDIIVYDELIHACIKEGSRLSHAKHYSFRHNDLHDLEKKLSREGANKFIVIEAVYSMDGDFAPLKEITTLAKKHNAYVIVDEAHSTAIFGEKGSGLTTQLGLDDQVYAKIMTFGKGVGAHGACIVGSRLLIDYLINFARSFIYTTALPLHAIATIKVAFEFLAEHEALQEKLQTNIRLFRQHIDTSVESLSAIQVICIPGNSNVRQVALTLKEAGFAVSAVMSPTVREGEERLRICVHAHNTEEEIIALAKKIKEVR